MNKVEIAALMLLMMISSAMATDSTLSPEKIKMDMQDNEVTQYCVKEDGKPLKSVKVIASQFCKDIDGIIGCSNSDVLFPDGFYIDIIDAKTDKTGCADIEITTDLTDGGLFYYTINGKVQDVLVSAETGRVEVDVPEFSFFGALGALGVIGLFLYHTRKENTDNQQDN